MKNLYKMTIAAVLAATMGVASATNVPGIPSDVFEFSKPGVAEGDTVVGDGVTAIANINAILDAVAGTGGGTLSKSAFWGSAVADTAVSVFEYDNAAPMIEELIFTVKGEFKDLNNGSWVVATGTDLTRMKGKTSKVTSLNSNGELAGGTFLNGKLSLTKTKALELLTMLKYNFTDRNTSFDGLQTTDITSVVSFTGPHSLIEKAKIIDGDVTDAVSAASLNKIAFQNANHLVALIAQELKTGYILDVEKATANLAKIADHHTGMLSATLVQQAQGIKDVIKNIGYLEAAVGVGKATEDACTVTVGINTITDKKASACTQIGQKFVDLSQNLTSIAGAGTLADAYQVNLTNIIAFADKIISFNDTLDGFNAGDEATKINNQFGTITVKVGTDLHDQLVADNGTAPTEMSITGNALDSSVSIEDYTLNGGAGSIVTGLDLGDDGAFDIVFDAPVL